MKTQNHIFNFFFLTFKNKLQSLERSERANAVNNFIYDLMRMCRMFNIERLQKKGALNLLDIPLNTCILCRFKDQISHACSSQIDMSFLTSHLLINYPKRQIIITEM